ncbi:hypothetical protein ASG11_03905 [Sphingomonas sp. Leaf357]|uniref:DUF6491 family protein n=1 Tax=Sphingomonas sp. Leaf357 TaxID=1736350 RepID=UPI000701DD6B|nr:DUF6491 family protein [Sphingomonas sp. Leaf357]KQS03508.1 hypothetical protein ASG11_03905 [Sphingomonas sp. Leaf357]
MRTVLIIPMLIAAGAATADSRSDQTDLARALAGRVAGAPVKCLDPRLADGPQVVGTQTLLYRRGNGRLWVNTLPEPCPGLRFNAVPVVEMFGGEMCRNDRFTPVTPGSIPGAPCRLGGFTPWDKPKR